MTDKYASSRKAIIMQRKQLLANTIGVPFEKIIENFVADLLGCGSGGSNERLQAREWLLFCFHQYFGSGNFDKDQELRKKVEKILYSFDEPTITKLENQ